MCRLLTFLLMAVFSALTHSMEEYNITTVQSQMCFLTAVSSTHYQNSLKYIEKAQSKYPCSKVYVYDLGKNLIVVGK